MAIDKNKIIAEATRLVQKGALDKAIGTYQKILNDDPKDVRVLLKVGELHQKKGDARLAAEAFQRVAETYADQGFFLKSVAVYKQIVKLEPDDVRVNERLAALYQQLGLLSDAMAQLQLMAAAHEKSADAAKLTDVLKRMVELDPENIASSIKLGELHARAHQNGPALDCFRRAADYLKKHSRHDDYVKVAERISALQPDDLALTRELANIYLAKGDTKRALAKLQLCFKADPKDVDTLQLLAQAFRDLGQTAKTLSVYKELAHVLADRGRHAESKAAWRKVLEVAPEDPEAKEVLEVAQPLPPPPASPPPPSPAGPAPRQVPSGPPPGATGPQRASPIAVAPGAARPSGAPAASPPAPTPPHLATGASGADAIPKLLTETDVYVKYGLVDKALDHLRKVVAIDPNHAEAHERARELHVQAGRMPDAAESAAAAVRSFLARGDGDRARESASRLRQISPGHPDLPELHAAAGGTEEVALGTAELEAEAAQEFEADVEVVSEPASAGDDDLALEAAGLEPPEEVVEDLVEDGPATAADDPGAIELLPDDEPFPVPDDALAEEAALVSAEADEVVDDAGPAPFELEPPALTPAPVAVRAALPVPAAPPAVIAPPAPVIASPAGARSPAPPPAPAGAVEPVPARAPAPPPAAAKAAAVARPPVPAIAPRPPPPPPPARAAAVEEEEEVDLTDELEEAGFFLDQGLIDEARDALAKLLEFYPDHAGLRAKVAEVERKAAPPPPRPPRATPPPVAAGGVRESPALVNAILGGEDFDIGRELALELDGEGPAAPVEEEFQYSVEDVFTQFKKGVEQTVKPEDSATHYDLGIAYKEMGLLDDAVGEFETALKGNDRKRDVDCLSMIGVCRALQGHSRDAIAAFRRALASELLTRDAAKALHYELGLAHKAAGDREVALFYLQKVKKLDPAFREVVAEVKALGDGPGQAPAEPAPRAPAPGAPRPGARPQPPPPGPKKNIGYL